MSRIRIALLAVGLSVPSLAAAQQDAATASTAAYAQDRRGWFGISLTCSECYIQRGAGRVAYTQAPAISSVESGSPAHQAGLRTGDTIIAIEGLSLTTPEGFEAFARARGGVAVRLTVRKPGEERREVSVVPSERSSTTTVQDFYNERLRIAQRRGFEALRSSFRSPLGWLGLSLECENCSTSNVSRRLQTNFRRWPVVEMVDVDGPAHRGGLRRGDTLTAIDDVDLATPAGGRLFASIEPAQRVMLTVRREGRDRRLPIVAVARLDATADELAAFNEYKRMRDSADAEYRQVLSSHVTRASAELRDLERLLRETEASRISVDSSRRKLAALDSVLRSLRRAESERSRMGSTFGPGVYSFGATPAAPVPMATPTPMVPPNVVVAPMAPGVVYPLRYSNRLRNVVNVEARAPGPVNVTEVGDSLIVLNMGGYEVKVQLRPEARR
jgi:hypothetical protein